MSELQRIEAQLNPDLVKERQNKLSRDQRKLTDMYSNILISRKRVDKLRQDAERLSQHRSALGELENTKVKLEIKIKQHDVKSIEEKYNIVYDQLTGHTATLQSMLNDLTRIGKFSGVCPVTRDQCPKGSDVETYRRELEKRIAEASTLANNLETEQSRLGKLLDSSASIVSDFNAIRNSIDATKVTVSLLQESPQLYKSHKSVLDADEKSYIDFKKQVDTLAAEVEAANMSEDLTYKTKLRELQQHKRDTDIRLDQANDRLASLMSVVKQLQSLDMDIKDAQDELRVVKDRELALKTLKPMLSQSGIPFMHILSSIAEFESSINKALQDLGTDLRVEVEPYTAMSTYVPVCQVCGFEYPKGSAVRTCPNLHCQTRRDNNRKETLEIRLKGRMFDVDFDEDSGGGKQWVSMGIRFALYNILRERGLMANIDFWILDEVFAPLSDVSKFAMLSFLENMCAMYGIHQLFLITHSDISSVVPPAVIVERSDALQESRILT